MRVVALGGCGGIGRHAVRTVLDVVPAATVVVADLDGDRARRFAAEHDRTEALAVDVSDPRALGAALEGADVVVQAVGPYFRFGVPVLRAAIAQGCDYVDVCDDWEPTLQMLALNDEARDAGVTAIIGLGASPGISNLLAVLAMDELDRAEDVLTGWCVDVAAPSEVGPEPSAAMVHAIHQLTGRVRVFEDGVFRDVRPLGAVPFDYPGLGRATGRIIGHPEAVTLPRYDPDLRRSINLVVGARTTMLALRGLTALVDLGWVKPRSAARFAEWWEGPGGETPSGPQVLADLERGSVAAPPLFAIARGTKDGRPAAVAATISAAPPGGMGGTTGVPLGLGVALLRDGAARGPGVLPPEAALDAGAFFDRLARRCGPERAGASDLVVLTRSWEDRSLLDALRAVVAPG